MKKSKVILISLFIFIFTLMGFSIIWCLTTWTRLSMDELVFELSAPIRGVGKDMMTKFLLKCLIPTLLFMVLLLVLCRKQAMSKRRILLYALGISAAFFTICSIIFWEKHDVIDYIRNQGDESTFIEDNYVDAGTASACFDLGNKDLDHPRVDLDIKLDGDNATVTASQLHLDSMDTLEEASLRGVIWDGTHYKHPIDFKFNKDSDSVYSANLDLKGYDPTDIYLEVYLFDDELKEEYRLMDWNGNLNLLKGTFAEELTYLFNNLQDRVVILNTVDSSPRMLDSEVKDILKEHGVKSFLMPEEDSCAFLVIDSDSINEDSSYEDLQNNHSYNANDISLSCSCWVNNYYTSIMINNHELCRNEHGINGVVYNYVADTVEDIFTYDANVFENGDFWMER